MDQVKYCKRCFASSLRPRISFNKDGVCSACLWAAEKKSAIDWKHRRNQLEELCNKYRRSNYFDCIVPVSGGKDGSYVAHKLKYTYHMNPLCITITPDLQLDIGKKNLEHFIDKGFDLLSITPNPDLMKQLNKKGFIEQGRPMVGWMLAVQAAVMKLAVMYRVPLIMFGEDGETEYGGLAALKNSPVYGVDEAINLYLSGNDINKLAEGLETTNNNYFWYEFPSEDDLKHLDIKVAHYSYFENWDSNEHVDFAIKHFNMEGQPERSIGTYTRYSQNDTMLYTLHSYLMFLKFGFGRCNQDASIDIRSGRMTRSEGLELLKKYDGEYPKKYINAYLKYFDMTSEEFNSILDKYANKDVLYKKDGYWKLKELPNL